MPPSSKQSLTKGRWRAVALSVLVHALIVAAAVFGWFTWKHEPPELETLAIEATVVDERALKGIAAKPDPAPLPPPPAPEPEPEPALPPEEQGPPKPDPAEIEQRQEEERQAQEKAEQEKRQRQQEQAEQEKKAQELKAREDAEKLEAEKVAAAKAAAEKAAAKAREEKLAAEKKAAEKKRAEDAAAARKAAEEKARQAQEAELRRSLEAEERGNAARNSAAASTWYAAIVSRIARAWIKPPSAVPGVTCLVLVSQVPGGEVTSVRVDSCNPNDAALRESVQAAVFRASPLPTPPPGVPFERNLELTFAPDR